MAKKREMQPIRFKVFRVDASIHTAERTIQSKFGLPDGSVKLVYPSGRKAKSDGTVGALIKHWDKKG
jgi:hypothetical protein